MLGGYLSDVTTTACAVTESGARSRTLLRSLAIVSVVICPAMVLRILGVYPEPVLGLLVYGGAVVGASFVLAWAAEAAQIDVSGSLAVAVLAVIAVLPEYAVDLYYAYTAGHVPAYTQYAAANMTGSNRLLMGIGWPVVVLIAVAVARKATGNAARALDLEPSNRVELGFLLIAGVAAFLIAATGQIHLIFGIALLAWFGLRGERGQPLHQQELVDAQLGAGVDETVSERFCAREDDRGRDDQHRDDGDPSGGKPCSSSTQGFAAWPASRTWTRSPLMSSR